MTTKLEITPLMEACQNSNSDDVEALLSKGVTLLSQTNPT
jgi:ankyrin repeat protein